MKLATILPTKYLPIMVREGYHMALGHLIGVDKEYTDFFAARSAEGAYVIMDNGVIEGDQQSIEVLCARAKLINASEIILPDVLMHKEETLKLTYDSLMYVKEKYPEFKVMVVPQGKDIEEWQECCLDMLDWDVDCIGVPKWLTRECGRDARLQVLSELQDALTDVEIHLLGCHTSPLEITMACTLMKSGKLPVIRGCDSALAFIYTKGGTKISDGPRPAVSIEFNETDIDEALLAINIGIWESSVEIEKGKVVKLL